MPFLSDCHEGERELIPATNGAESEGEEFAYYYKPALDPLMGNDLEVQLIQDEARMTPQELNEQRISPARYESYSMTPGSANTFKRFDQDSTYQINTLDFENNIPLSIDSKNKNFYKCKPGTSISGIGSKLCTNPNNSFDLVHNQTSIKQYINPLQVEHLESAENKTIFYGESDPDDDVSNKNKLLIKGKNSPENIVSDYLLGNLVTSCLVTNTLFAPVTKYKKIDRKEL